MIMPLEDEETQNEAAPVSEVVAGDAATSEVVQPVEAGATSPDVDALHEEIDRLTASGAEKDAAIAELTKQRDEALAALDKATATVTTKAKSSKPAKVGPLKTDPTPVELAEMLAGTVTVRASDGKSELTDFPPVEVNGASNWMTLGGGRYVLAKDIDFTPEGKQIAWGALPDPIRLVPGQQNRLNRAIIFG
jgi:hypothetical protein